TKSSELILGIRPQNMLLHLNQVKNSHEVKVYIIENLGGEYLVNLKMGENILKVITSVFLPIKSGDKLWFTFNKNEIHIFDKKGGKTLI
ncbi:MAG: TOBE domain-containing protein, partial [Asgard group archaeon]